MKCRKTEMRSEMSRFVVLFTLTLHKFIILNGEWTIFVLPPSIFSGSFFFSGILPPEVKKMLCGDYGNNNGQENCLLKKINEDPGNVRICWPFSCVFLHPKKTIFFKNSTDGPEITRNFI